MPRDALADLQNFLGSLEGWSLDVRFDPDDPESVATAIKTMEQAIDQTAARYRGTPAVMQMAEDMKEQYRQGIREQKHEDPAPDAEEADKE